VNLCFENKVFTILGLVIFFLREMVLRQHASMKASCSLSRKGATEG